ncbi:tetratricopeptide repeat protein 9C isoform 2-T2 [Pholidichthys leucotaenia]
MPINLICMFLACGRKLEKSRSKPTQTRGLDRTQDPPAKVLHSFPMMGAGKEDSDEEVAAPLLYKSQRLSTERIWTLLHEAGRLKAKGNIFYREKNIRSAVSCYHRALLIIRSVDPEVTRPVKGYSPDTIEFVAEQVDVLREVQLDCYNNLAACLLQKPSVDYSRVLKYSLLVLKWRPANVKALYRAGVATLGTGNAQEAKEYFIKAHREQPNDARVRRHLQMAEEKLNLEHEREKAMCRDMFSSN